MGVLEVASVKEYANIVEFLKEKNEHFEIWKEIHDLPADTRLEDVEDEIFGMIDSDADEIVKVLDQLYPDKLLFVDYDEHRDAIIVRELKNSALLSITVDDVLQIAKEKNIQIPDSKLNEALHYVKKAVKSYCFEGVYTIKKAIEDALRDFVTFEEVFERDN